jgi:glycosyltransferase involved in cell wall biosynthesis
MKRKKIGLLFQSNYKEWAGGVIYILNIISALNQLEDSKKPTLYIYHKPDSPVEDIMAIRYPYIKFFTLKKMPRFGIRVLNYFFLALSRRSLYVQELPDIVYPDLKILSFGRKPIHWIPDFQDYYLPQMWSEADRKAKAKYHQSIASRKGIVVFSSEDAMNDFQKFYPDYKCELRLLRFACTLPSFKDLDIGKLKEKYGIVGEYFMAPNQFWKHKNQKLILEAVNMLKANSLDFQVVFTGSPSDHRHSKYFFDLTQFVKENKIERWVKFLGFIKREEQLKLMDNAIAVIQPSLFEGWSTVVEDAKAQSQLILLSDLAVHREQATENCRFFNPRSPDELAALINEFVHSHPARKPIDYTHNIKSFAQDFVKVVSY